MIEQLKTIREFYEAAYTTGWPRLSDAKAVGEALTQLEAMVGKQEPVAWMVTTELQDGIRSTYPLSGRYKDVRVACDFGEPVPLYAAPVAQQPPHDHVAVTWDAARTRILAVTLQDAEGRVLCVIDEAPDQQPQTEPICVSCRCFDEVSKRLCADKNRCFQAVAASAAPQQAEAVPPSNLIDPGTVVSFAVDRWLAEVANRPLVNVNRRTLDDTWRQVIRRFGGDPNELLGPSHDELAAIAQQKGASHE